MPGAAVAGSLKALSRYLPIIGRAREWTPRWTPAYCTVPTVYHELQALRIGETGFEPATARPPAGCATRLRHSPWLSRKRATGIEPALEAWKASVQPQHFARSGRADHSPRDHEPGAFEARLDGSGEKPPVSGNNLVMQIPGVHIETLHNPTRYSYAQIEKACTLAALLNRGKLVLVEPPRSR
jgi:hypothetical protein